MNIKESQKTDILVNLLPRSSKNEIVGDKNGVLKIKVTSPPVDGRANKALIELLSKHLGIAKTNIELIAGKNSRQKTVRIYGLSQEKTKTLFGK